MSYKKSRLRHRVLDAAKDPAFFDQVHVIFGGTGAVGGAMALQLVAIFEEAARRRPHGGGGTPRVVVTGRGQRDLEQFSRLLLGVQLRDHGAAPEQVSEHAVRTVGGVLVHAQQLSVDPKVPALVGFPDMDHAARDAAVATLLEGSGPAGDASTEQRLDAICAAIHEGVGRPFTGFLQGYLETEGLPGGATRFRSVSQGIPLASLAAYALGDLASLAGHVVPGCGHEVEDRIKSAVLEAIRDDFAHIAEEMAEEVQAAHTTGVGGMYDDVPDGNPRPRLDFAHRARDKHLVQKQILADRLTEMYAQKGIKMLITAAAIGVDAVIPDWEVPLQASIAADLRAAARAGSPVVAEADLATGAVMVYPPVEVPLTAAPHEPVSFDGGTTLRLSCVVRSSENGYFTVSNADALYRVMRVAGTGELGLTLARVAAIGDDPECPTYVDCRNFYIETDHARQVMDLLAQPEMRAAQHAGLQPKALQDLGSSKHQGELHTLGLVVLLHRVRTLDGGAPPEGDDAGAWFEHHSEAPLLDHVDGWDVATLSADLTTLATARSAADLAPLNGFFAGDDDFVASVAARVTSAVAAIPSLGTPIVFDRGDGPRALVGPYAAPAGCSVTHADTLAEVVRASVEEAGGGDAAVALEFQLANFGFVDLRPQATLAACRTVKDALAGAVRTFTDVASFVEALDGVEPYTHFSTGGVLALLVRLRCLLSMGRELRVDMGSANEFRAHLPRDDAGRFLLVPGVIETFRMISEGWEKNTGMETLDGPWGYGQDRPAFRSGEGLRS